MKRDQWEWPSDGGESFSTPSFQDIYDRLFPYL